MTTPVNPVFSHSSPSDPPEQYAGVSSPLNDSSPQRGVAGRNSSPHRMSRRYYIYLGVGILCLVGVIVGVAIELSKGSDEKASSSQNIDTLYAEYSHLGPKLLLEADNKPYNLTNMPERTLQAFEFRLQQRQQKQQDLSRVICHVEGGADLTVASSPDSFVLCATTTRQSPSCTVTPTDEASAIQVFVSAPFFVEWASVYCAQERETSANEPTPPSQTDQDDRLILLELPLEMDAGASTSTTIAVDPLGGTVECELSPWIEGESLEFWNAEQRLCLSTSSSYQKCSYEPYDTHLSELRVEISQSWDSKATSATTLLCYQERRTKESADTFNLPHLLPFVSSLTLEDHDSVNIAIAIDPQGGRVSCALTDWSGSGSPSVIGLTLALMAPDQSVSLCYEGSYLAASTNLRCSYDGSDYSSIVARVSRGRDGYKHYYLSCYQSQGPVQTELPFQREVSTVSSLDVQDFNVDLAGVTGSVQCTLQSMTGNGNLYFLSASDVPLCTSRKGSAADDTCSYRARSSEDDGSLVVRVTVDAGEATSLLSCVEEQVEADQTPEVLPFRYSAALVESERKAFDVSLQGISTITCEFGPYSNARMKFLTPDLKTTLCETADDCSYTPGGSLSTLVIAIQAWELGNVYLNCYHNDGFVVGSTGGKLLPTLP